jgi:type I restriction enzyme S subunit
MFNNEPVFPDDWETATLGECCDILDSQRVPISEDERNKRKGDVPYYGANGQVGWIDTHIFDDDLVLLAEDGGNFDEYATRPIAYRVTGKSWVNNHAHVLRARGEMTSTSWVFRCLEHADIRGYIRGSTRAKLNKGQLVRIAIPFPEPAEQRRIAEILDTADEAIQKTEALIAKLKQMKAGLLHDLLTRGIDENGELRCLSKQVDSEIGKIAEDWKLTTIADIASPRDYAIVDGPDYSLSHFRDSCNPKWLRHV